LTEPTAIGLRTLPKGRQTRAAILEVARSLSEAIRAGRIDKPSLTIRFLWLPEIAGSQAWLARHPDIAARLVGGIHMDMVGGLLSTTHGTFHLSRTAESLPHVLNDIGRAFFEQIVAASAHYAEHGGDPYAGFVAPGASRDPFLGDIRALELGSDHEVFEAAGWGVPMLYFHDWPDVTIHTNKDQPENLDATKLGRVAYLGAGIAYTLAALPDAAAPKLVALARESAEQQLAHARRHKALAEDTRDGALAVREATAQIGESLATLTRRWPSTAPAVGELLTRLKAETSPVPAIAGRDARVPVRSPEIRGPLDVYYYDHVSEALAARGEPTSLADMTTLDSGDASLIQYEALNLADGRRSVAEIRDVLTGRYGAVPIGFVGAYFERLGRAGVVSLRPATVSPAP